MEIVLCDMNKEYTTLPVDVKCMAEFNYFDFNNFLPSHNLKIANCDTMFLSNWYNFFIILIMVILLDTK